ncbi:MAG: glutamine-hydrolyzing carbamoyl-phosphate synthase small subunit [Clostridia bacterium]|nr:glutamine-hydrolyzing carbamoyl-phosphate synthase small subunit [Clostridia bacterium]
MKDIYLVLVDKKVFKGKSIGADTKAVGELVFTTGMNGYLETLTDPSYAGQIVVQTFPLIGNYGVIPSDFEGKSAVNGYVVNELCEYPSNFRSEYKLNEYLKDNGICGICGVDTREITRIIRNNGVINAMLCEEIPDDLSELENYSVKDVVKTVSTKDIKKYQSEGNAEFNVALIDYGAKQNIIRSLTKRGCNVTVFPYDTPAETILSSDFDGVMLSNGPGDPAENLYSIEQIKKLVGNIPVFGICLGHQLTALAMGGKTEKLKFGHRGANQPVTCADGSRTFITSQNHGYAVVSDSLKGIGNISYYNANDLSCEGVDYPGKSCFTVQFHPEACSGPKDTEFLFSKFTGMMEDYRHAER